METKEIVREVVIKAIFISRRDRNTHPDGHFDKAGRWWPSAEEECDCCDNIREPSRRWPYNYLVHCRSAAHVRNMVTTTYTNENLYAAFASSLSVLLKEKKGVAGLLKAVCKDFDNLVDLIGCKWFWEKHGEQLMEMLKDNKAKAHQIMTAYLAKTAAV